jgi:hypothetical protein
MKGHSYERKQETGMPHTNVRELLSARLLVKYNSDNKPNSAVKKRLIEAAGEAASIMRSAVWKMDRVVPLARTRPRQVYDEGADGFRLNPHGRYSHREAYLRTMLGDAGLVDIRLQAAHLRMEGGRPVDGFVVSARSAEAPGHG